MTMYPPNMQPNDTPHDQRPWFPAVAEDGRVDPNLIGDMIDAWRRMNITGSSDEIAGIAYRVMVAERDEKYRTTVDTLLSTWANQTTEHPDKVAVVQMKTEHVVTLAEASIATGIVHALIAGAALLDYQEEA